MKRLLILLLTMALVGCSGIIKVEGDQMVNSRMVVKVADAWNKITFPALQGPYDLWTQEGLTLDQLRLWAALKPGQALMARPPGSASAGQTSARLQTFVAGMTPDQTVRLFEEMFAADGSLVTMTKVEPAVFANEKGVRFEFGVIRKSDEVQLRGVGWVAVSNGELFAATFVAPRLSFFPRLLPKVEAVIRTAQVRG